MMSKEEVINRAAGTRLENQTISQKNWDFIKGLIANLRSTKGISHHREIKIIYSLLQWGEIIPDFSAVTIKDLHAAIVKVREKRYEANTVQNHIVIIKQFYRYMIDEGLVDNITEDQIRKIKTPPGQYRNSYRRTTDN